MNSVIEGIADEFGVSIEPLSNSSVLTKCLLRRPCDRIGGQYCSIHMEATQLTLSGYYSCKVDLQDPTSLVAVERTLKDDSFWMYTHKDMNTPIMGQVSGYLED